MADGALLEHRDAAHTVLFRQEIRRGEPVAAAADNQRVIARLRLSRPQYPWPALVAAQGVQGECRKGIARHRLSSVGYRNAADRVSLVRNP